MDGNAARVDVGWFAPLYVIYKIRQPPSIRFLCRLRCILLLVEMRWVVSQVCLGDLSAWNVTIGPHSNKCRVGNRGEPETSAGIGTSNSSPAR